MKRSFMRAAVLVIVLASTLMLVVGCGANGASLPGLTPEQRMEQAQVQWSGYTMGFEQVTDDQDALPPLGTDTKLEGKGLKVCFRYVSDDDFNGGFVSETLFNDLEDDEIVLKDSSGRTYEWLGFISDITLEGDFMTSGFSLAKTMPRFSIVFDVPADSSIEDFTLSTGTGDGVPLAAYTSAEYAEYLAED